MGSILLVPIHLDALCLKTDLSVIEPKCDFARLPYWDGVREVNPDVANLSEGLLSHPFQDRGLQLRAGIHLHWALPDALTKGTNRPHKKGVASKLTFPAVPNRWLVTRSTESGDPKQWLVESDFLYPEAAGNVEGYIAIPFPSDPAKGLYRPFRYLGRTRPVNGQCTEDSAAETLTKEGYQLTVVGYEPQPQAGPEKTGGYGEPTFAAFYPNCLSVFGFHDPLPPKSLMGLRYEVIGWYSDIALDCLHTTQFLQVIEATRKATPKPTDDSSFIAALEKAFKWKALVKGDLPDRTVCYARLDITVADVPSSVLEAKPVKVAVGNTTTEALSAYLADGDTLLEDQLEALHLSSRLEGKELDVGLKFREARHEKGFTAVPGGTLWSVRQQSSAIPSPGPGNAADDTEEETLPKELAHPLNALNLQQQAYDRAAHELESMQNQLFADWYKYMLCSYPPDDIRDDYPDVDEARHFIEKNGLLAIKRQRATLNALDFQRQQRQKDLETISRNSSKNPNKPYTVQPHAAPRYWRPNEPALLIVGEIVEPTKRHGQDGRLNAEGLLECQLLEKVNGAIENNIQAIQREISKNQPGKDQKRIGFHAWEEQPWNPFALEWKVKLLPQQGYSNQEEDDRNYRSDFITKNYLLAEDAVDLELQPGQEGVLTTTRSYSGSCLLTPQARLQLQNQIKSFVEKRPKPNSTGKDTVADALGKVSDKLNDLHAMAQTLNGLNEAFLMRKQTMQLPIAEPLGFDDAKQFSEAVRKAVGNQNRSAPQPLNDFNPIRAGVLKILNLRLLDTFGRTQTLVLEKNRVIATDVMSTPGAPHLITLPPRLVQPARLNFRWLAADSGDAADEVEMNAHPATTPICGWLIPNYLDNSLMVYDNTGQSLGSIILLEKDKEANHECQWMSAPGKDHITVEQIGNLHLQKLVSHLLKRKKDYFEDFLTALEGALENIDPESFAQHEALSLLMGRPIAVVRAMLDLELRGRPAINRHWNVFRLDIERDLRSESGRGSRPALRDTDEFTKVQFPIRLGDERQLNDGLVGYWKEIRSTDSQSYEYENNRFYVHACDTATVVTTNLDGVPVKPDLKPALVKLLQDNLKIVKRHTFLAKFADGDEIWQLLCDKHVITEFERDEDIRYAADEPEIYQAIDSPPQKLTMLVDPRGAVHASSGVLPTKAIRIPPDQYAKALQNLKITFLSAPILTRQGEINLPLPAEPGHVWSWVSKTNGNWNPSEIKPANLQATFSGHPEIREGWLQLTEEPEKQDRTSRAKEPT